MSRNGFTLLELLIAVSIMLLLAAGVFGLMNSGRRIWLISDAQIDVYSQARQSMNRLVEDLTAAGPGFQITALSPTSDRIEFRAAQSFSGGAMVWGNRIQYELGGTGQQLVRRDIDNGTTEMFGNYITALRFNQLRADLIEIMVETTRQSVTGEWLQFNLVAQVAVRNR